MHITGQSPLHLAIVNDDYETVQLLLELGVDVCARACGYFFAPEDHTAGTANQKTTNYQGAITCCALICHWSHCVLFPQVIPITANIRWHLRRVLVTKMFTIC